MRLILFLSILFYSHIIKADFDLVYDIDYTLTHEVPEGTPGAIKLKYDKLSYRVNDWVLEGIENIIDRDGVSINFFSGGPESRNIELLKKIKLSDGRFLHDIAKKIFSRRHLEPTGKTEGKFGQRFKKNLRRLGFNLKRTLMIDDYERFLPRKQQNNMLWIGKTYHYYHTYPEAQLAISKLTDSPQFVPAHPDSWFIAKNKFKFINELLLDAFDTYDPKLYGPEALKFIQANKHQYIPYDEVFDPHFKELYGPLNQTPSLCFRVYSIFRYPR